MEDSKHMLDQLRDAVAEMRHAQREYFRTRSANALERAKRAEARVDQMLAPQPQQRLFP